LRDQIKIKKYKEQSQQNITTEQTLPG
ncbi:MAG: hypothetical protein CI949_4221, partial [Halanaerobium sp.]